jgi:hypothetical protein
MTRAVLIAPRWRRWLAHVRDWLHRRAGCECIVVDTDEGIGGQCITCGRVYGWMTREELMRVYPRRDR